MRPNRRPGSSPRRSGPSPRLCLASSGPSPLATCAEAFSTASDRVVAAAAVLGENQRIEEEPGALSALGGALANAGRDLVVAAAALDEDADWPAAADALAGVAGSLREAAAASDAEGMDGLDGAAAELEDASCVTGCIALAAAAGPNLQEAAAGVNLASIWLGSRSEALDTGCTPAHRAAGDCMSAAALAMKEAARSLHDAGARLESGELGAGA